MDDLTTRTISEESDARRNARRLTVALVLVIVPLVLLLLLIGALIVPKLISHGTEAKVAAARSDIAQFSSALDTFRLNCGCYPTEREGLGALLTAPKDAKEWKGPYVAKLPADPWGHNYVYKHPGPKGDESYIVRSYGADGQPGGEGDNADIDNTD